MSKRKKFNFVVSLKKSASTLVYWAIAVALLPVLWAVVAQTGLMFPALWKEGASSWWLYLAGAAIYFVFEYIFEKPMWFYVVGHEMTHAISGFLSGAKIYSFKAGSKGGEVRLSKSNAFIALSPYIIPIYAIGTLIFFAALQHWWNRPEILFVFKFVLGMALAFHLSLTASALHGHQTDLKVLGFFLSGVLVMLGNVLILGFFAIGLFQRTPTLKSYARGVATETVNVLKISYELIKQG